ncbi:MAG TPA: hypothetical protein VLC46_04180 [Thermoanaerobaculia bacterium]|nr:hypothetical protein [Thermoanaerobaculia bacterium]
MIIRTDVTISILSIMRIVAGAAAAGLSLAVRWLMIGAGRFFGAKKRLLNSNTSHVIVTSRDPKTTRQFPSVGFMVSDG